MKIDWIWWLSEHFPGVERKEKHFQRENSISRAWTWLENSSRNSFPEVSHRKWWKVRTNWSWQVRIAPRFRLSIMIGRNIWLTAEVEFTSASQRFLDNFSALVIALFSTIITEVDWTQIRSGNEFICWSFYEAKLDLQNATHQLYLHNSINWNSIKLVPTRAVLISLSEFVVCAIKLKWDFVVYLALLVGFMFLKLLNYFMLQGQAWRRTNRGKRVSLSSFGVIHNWPITNWPIRRKYLLPIIPLRAAPPLPPSPTSQLQTNIGLISDLLSLSSYLVSLLELGSPRNYSNRCFRPTLDKASKTIRNPLLDYWIFQFWWRISEMFTVNVQQWLSLLFLNETICEIQLYWNIVSLLVSAVLYFVSKTSGRS